MRFNPYHILLPEVKILNSYILEYTIIMKT